MQSMMATINVKILISANTFMQIIIGIVASNVPVLVGFDALDL